MIGHLFGTTCTYVAIISVPSEFKVEGGLNSLSTTSKLIRMTIGFALI